MGTAIVTMSSLLAMCIRCPPTQHATTLDDVNAYYPVSRLGELVDRGRIGELAPRFHGVYTGYSKRKTAEIDAPEVLRRCIEDEVDVAVMTPV
jgi:D-proline reductase (dithiol) PrdB